MSNSFELANYINSIDWMKVRSFINDEFKEGDIPPAEVYDKIIANNELHQSVKTLLNQFEVISVAIQKKYACEEILEKFLGYAIPYYYNAFLPYIERMRREYNPLIFIECEKLVNAWKAKKYLHSSKSILG